MKKLLLVGAAGVVALCTPRAVLAHHGWGGYQDQEFEISGTVEKPVSLAGPHATMTIKGTDGHDWLLTLAPPPRTSASGLKDGMLSPGTKVTAHGHRSRDNNRFEVKTERLTVGDKTYNVYPDRT